MIENIPFAPVMGNHETYNMDWQIAPPTPYLTLFNLPENGTDANKTSITALITAMCILLC